jgi:hypothetical protein
MISAKMSKSSAIGEWRVAQKSLGTVDEFEVEEEVFFSGFFHPMKKQLHLRPL